MDAGLALRDPTESQSAPRRSQLGQFTVNLSHDYVHRSSSDSGPSADESTSAAGGKTDDANPPQATMWVGTEDGCIYVYSCSDYIRRRKTTGKIQMGAAVMSIVYLNSRVFVGLGSGAVATFGRTEGMQIDSPRPMVTPPPSLKAARLIGPCNWS